MSKALLLKIKECISILEQHKGDSGIIREVAAYILSEPGFLNDSDEATGLLNVIADVIEGREASFEQTLQAFTLYWQSLIRACGVTLFYIGNVDNVKLLAANLDKRCLTDIYYLSGSGNPDEIQQLIKGLETTAAPFVIYDPEGAKLLKSVNLAQALVVAPYYELMFFSHRLTSHDKSSHAAWLEKQYREATGQDVQTLVLGNSYGYYAFPEKSIARAVNLSMHSLSIKQAHALVFHALTNLTHVNHFVFCFGLFDLYCDLFKTKDHFNKGVIDAFSLFFADNQIVMPCLTRDSRLQMLASLLLQNNSHTPTAWPDDSLAQVENAINLLLNAKDYVDPQQHNDLAVMRAQAHSRLVKHSAILEENKTLITEMLEALNACGKSATWLVPPFPAQYVRTVDEEMKQTNHRFLTQQGEEKLRFIDWSENKDFERKHFRDGDHLNFEGAKKVVIKLRKVGVAL